MRFLFSALALVALVVFALPARADAPPSLDEYRRAIAQALALAQQANNLPVSERAPLLADAADLLDNIQAVQINFGASLPVNNFELLKILRDPAKTPDAIARLTALRDVIAQPLVTVDPSNLAHLRDILEHPPFTQNVSDSWIQALLRALDDFFSRLFTNTAQGILDVRDLLVLGAVLGVILVILYFLRNLRHNLVPDEQLPPLLAERDARTPAEAFDNAQRFIQSGDYRSAVRQLYLATLLTLDLRGRIRYDPALTNREYLGQAAQDPRIRAMLQPLVETFDRTWYGFEPISMEELDAYRRRVEQVREL